MVRFVFQCQGSKSAAPCRRFGNLRLHLVINREGTSLSHKKLFQHRG